MEVQDYDMSKSRSLGRDPLLQIITVFFSEKFKLIINVCVVNINVCIVIKLIINVYYVYVINV